MPALIASEPHRLLLYHHPWQALDEGEILIPHGATRTKPVDAVVETEPLGEKIRFQCMDRIVTTVWDPFMARCATLKVRRESKSFKDPHTTAFFLDYPAQDVMLWIQYLKGRLLFTELTDIQKRTCKHIDDYLQTDVEEKSRLLKVAAQVVEDLANRFRAAHMKSPDAVHWTVELTTELVDTIATLKPVPDGPVPHGYLKPLSELFTDHLSVFSSSSSSSSCSSSSSSSSSASSASSFESLGKYSSLSVLIRPLSTPPVAEIQVLHRLRPLV